jgi:predicted O-linked N-acetylglucosamine transferase (SPINDLY family)
MTTTDGRPALLNQLIHLTNIGNFQQALDAYLPVIDAGKPNDWHINYWVELLHYVAKASRAGRNNAQAITLYRQAIALHPEKSLRVNLALCYLDQHEYDKAEELLGVLVAHDADFSYAWFLRGQGAQSRRQWNQARTYFNQAAIIQPDQPDLLLAQINLARQLCDWGHHAAYLARAWDLRKQSPDHPLVLLEATCNIMDNDDPNDHRLLSIVRSQQVQSTIDPTRVFHHTPTNSDRPLKIGYLSANFIRHPGAMLMRGIFGHHNRDQVEIYGYALTPDDGSIYRRDAMRDMDHFYDLTGMDGYKAAHKIHADGIQVLVDMKGWSENNRQDILAWRPAPIQISYLGYAAPMIAPWIDYQIVDPILVPPEEQESFGPSLIMMPVCYQPNDNQRPITSPPPSRSSQGLADDKIILACFNNPQKITAQIFSIWMKILQQRPKTVLWLMVDAPETMQNLYQFAEQYQINQDQILFAGPMASTDHLARLSLADLAVDTFPYGGHTSTSDALWAGVPVVTLRGKSFASRVAASLLTACNLSSLISDNEDDYLKKILDLIDDPERLTGIKNYLRTEQKNLPLFQTAAMAQQLEQVYQQTWQIFNNA